MTTSADQVLLFDRLVFQQLLELQRKTRFCTDGLNEVLTALDIDDSLLVEDAAVIVTGTVYLTTKAHLTRLIDEGPTERELIGMNNIGVRATAPPVTLADIDQTDPAVVARQAQVRAYALKRFSAEDMDDQVSPEAGNRFLVALGIKPLVLKRYAYLVPVSSKVRYEVFAETEIWASEQVSKFIREDIDRRYLEHGDPGEDQWPDPDGVFELVAVQDL